ncbi:cyclic nucleotide-binding domain-containing protein [Desulfoluna sp.]|uniref:cyclic nucleotide-binding domain-containing protein n=1 Tax=Desulfoluna sp. TaxID=2045199 RepID=UPI00261F409C|nr:cyclic nucleotide-binding domain-containing protein [Desulfoluna sp.]
MFECDGVRSIFGDAILTFWAAGLLRIPLILNKGVIFMADELNLNTASVAVNLFMSAVKSCRLYPETSDIVKNSLSTGYKRLTTVFYREAPFVVSEAEGAILFDGKLLDPRAQRMPQIHSLRVLMESLNLKSIAFDRGIDAENYAKFSRVLSIAPEEMEALGGVRKILDTEGVVFVSVNHRVFVEAETDVVIQSDEELFRYIWYNQISDTQALGYITRKISSTEWLKAVSRRFFSYIGDRGFEANDWETIAGMARLSGFLILAGMERGHETIFPLLYRSLDALGPWFNCDALALNFSNMNVTQGVDQLDNDSFMMLSARLLLMAQSQRRGSRLVTGAHLRLYANASDWMLSLPRGIELKYPVDELRKREERLQKIELVRIEVLIEALADGDFSALADPEVLAALPRTLTEKVQQGRGGEAEALIQSVSRAINLEDENQSILAIRVLLHSARAFISLERWDMVIRVVAPINLWARYQQGGTPLYESVADMMVNYVHNMVTSRQLASAIPVVETFSLIESGRLKKNTQMTEFAAKTLRRMASERVFNAIMAEFRKNEKGRREHTANFLVLLGKISAPPLLDLLRESDVMAERIRTMGILLNIGPAALGEITDRIKPDSAWFYLRNLLKILGEIGSEEQVDILEPLMLRDEEPVLDAVISCVKQIGGDKCPRFFSKAILQVPNEVKPRLAESLSQLGGDEAVYALSEVLKSKLAGTPEERHQVIQAVCLALGEIGSMKALPTLQLVVDQRGLLGRSRFTSGQKSLAEEAILRIRDAISKERTTAQETEPDTRVKVTREYIAEEDFSILDAIVNGLISGGKTPSALRMLLLMVERAAREKDFQRAERYKMRISDVDELALSETVRAEEIIEQEKRFVDSGEYLETWKDLYELLTDEEASSFYYHTKNTAVEVDAEIISQGEVINRLCFINSGRLKIIYRDGSKEIFIKELGKGDVVGYDAFFRTNVSTASLVALTGANVGFLDRESLKTLETKHPECVQKLRTFCRRFNNLSETVQAKGVERRRYKRFDVDGKVVLQLLTDTGTTVGKAFSGAMIDLSEGGLSVEVKSSGYAMARLLLGRSICSLMTPGEHADSFSIQGRVSSVNARGENAISIHIAFVEPMAVSVLETFVTSI